MEKTTLAPRSKRLFTFSSLYGANKALLNELEIETADALELAVEFWANLSMVIDEWELVRKRKLTAGEVREDFIHTHGVILQALARAGNELIKNDPKCWKERLQKLKSLSWRRADSAIWEGRALINGRLSKSTRSVILSSNKIKEVVGLELTKDELKLEKELEVINA